MGNLNILLIFLFSLIDVTIFISILSKFRNNNNYYKSIDVFVIILMSIIISFFTYFEITPYIKMILVSILLFFTVFIYKLKFYEQILVVIFHYFMLIISELLVTFLLANILYINLGNIDAKYTYLFLGLFSKLLAILTLLLINRKFFDSKIVLPKKLNYIAIFTFSLSIASMVLLFYSSLSLSSENTVLIIFLICLLTFFSSIGTLAMYFNANNFYLDLQKQTVKNIYNKSYEKFINNAEIRKDNLSKVWHDIGNHINVLEKINKAESPTYGEYIDSIKDKIKDIPNTINTGNKLVDIILNDKYQEATIHKIDFHIKAIVPPKINTDNMDLSSILFNTIDNAIEACINYNGEDKYIYLELLPDGNFLSYKIKNSYKSDKTNSSENVYFNKKQYISSGYGLSIVKDIVDKYDGYIDINKDGEEYRLDIVLHL